MSSGRKTASPRQEVEVLHREERNEFIADLYSKSEMQKTAGCNTVVAGCGAIVTSAGVPSPSPW